MGSAAGMKRALAQDSNMMKTSIFRLFRWSPDFEIGKQSTLVAVWMKFFNLPLDYYNEVALHKLGSLLGNLLCIHHSTLGLMNQISAKACIEMDVSKLFLDKLWIGT